MPKFLPGHSGNPRGRPPKTRALSDLLAVQGELPIDTDSPMTHQAQLARNLWQMLTHGQIELSGFPVRLSAKDWVETAKFVVEHIDGKHPGSIFDSQIEIIVTRASPPALELPEMLLHDDEA